jgi:hypothetical protein
MKGIQIVMACGALGFTGLCCSRAIALPKSAAGLNWVRYTDSAEGAFSIEVPVGWQVQGGMYRFGYFDVRWMIDVRSLDGKLILRINDPNVPPYVLPGPHVAPLGHAEIKPQQYQMMVENYREAEPYADSYARHRFGSVCKSMTPRAADWQPKMPASWQGETGSRMTQASVSYDCATSDGPRTVIVFAINTLHPQSGLWQSVPVSIIATPDNVPLGESMMQRMIDSWAATPEWLKQQDDMTKMGLDQIRKGFGQFLQQMQTFHQQRQAAMNQQVAHFEAQQHGQAQQVSGWGETLTGLTTVSDSATGTQFQVFDGPKANFYTNGNGVTINSNLSPGPEFRELNPVGR